MSATKTIKKLIVPITVLLLLVGGVLALNHFVFSTPEEVQAPTASVIDPNGRKLLFSDEFNDTAVDESKWNYCYDMYSYQYGGCTNYGNWENEWYLPSQVTEGTGNLILTAEKEKTKGDNRYNAEQDYAYKSGMVSTGAKDKESTAKWEGNYGYYEARMLVPEGQAIWPAFWLLPTDREWPPEIDIMEVLGQEPNEVINTYHWKSAEGTPAQDTTTVTIDKSTSESWHTYAVNWQPGKIEWYVDDKLTKTAVGENIPSKNMQIIFNLAVGGTLPGEIDETTPQTAVMLVDYVRVYDKK